jgi:hypothetical protein
MIYGGQKRLLEAITNSAIDRRLEPLLNRLAVLHRSLHCWASQQWHPSRVLKLLLLALLCVSQLATASHSATAADEQKPKKFEILGVHAGIAGKYKVGCWTQLDVLLRGGPENHGGVVVVAVPDGDGVPSEVVSAPIAVLANSPTTARVYIKPGREMPDIVVRFVEVNSAGDAGRVIAKRSFECSLSAEPLRQGPALSDREQLIVGVGGPTGIESAAKAYNMQAPMGGTITEVRIDNVGRLPTRWYGFDGVDTVVLATSNADIYQPLTPASPQITALRQWVELGGRLVLVVGSQADLLLAPGSALGQFVPGRFTNTVPLKQLRSFEAFANANEPLTDGDSLDNPLLVPQLVDVRGQIEVQEGGDLPLVVRAPLGFGEVVFIGADFDRPPFLTWPDRGRFMARLLGYVPLEKPDESNPYGNLGYNDLAGSLRAALDQFKGVRIAPFWFVASLVLGYLMLIGPIDYFLVKRVLGRMELTWVTFPAMVIAVSAGAYFLANWMKGNELIVNQIDLIDVDLARAGAANPGNMQPAVAGQTQRDASAPLVRGTSWFNVFSPSRSAYDVTIATKSLGIELAGERQLVAWMGQPGQGLGGMSGRATAPVLDWPYQFAGDLTSLAGVPIQNWSSKPFVARFDGEAKTPGLAFELKAGAGELLLGSVTNLLTEPLEGCLLAYRGTAYPITRLEPGQKFELDPGTRRDLAAELTERQGSENQAPALQFRYGRGMQTTVSMETTAIIERLAFYQASGGLSAAKLINRSAATLDGSTHLAAGQAILFGRTEKPATTVELQGKVPTSPRNQNWTYRRWFLPVEPVRRDQE